MKRKIIFCLIPVCLLMAVCSYSQSADSAGANAIRLPSRFVGRIDRKTADLDRQLSRQTEKYLQKITRREARMQQKLAKLDPAAAKNLFAGSAEQYAAFARKIQQDTGSRGQAIGGDYQPYTDSLRGMLGYLQHHFAGGAGVDGAQRQLQTLQAKMQDADQVRDYVRQRKQQIGDYIGQHAGLAGALGKEYQGLNQDLYYYSQQVRQYKEMLNDPDKMMQQALTMLNKLPAFQDFMKHNGQLAVLFNLPSNYGSPEAVAGLQTRDQVSALIQGRVASAGTGGAAAMQGNIQAAESQLSDYKDKLGKLGKGSGDIDMPNFKPNDQKVKKFWNRLEYGANFQTIRNNYYFPTVSDLGVSVGYKLSDRNTVGLGASYKLGWGNGIQHITFSSQGLGLRSFIDIKIKSSFFASGGFEYNYTTPFRSTQQLRSWDNWTRSGLLGVSKTVSLKSRVFKKTKLQLLWDFLSYSQVPKTQAIIFRVGYAF